MKKAISLRIDEDILDLIDAVAVNSGYNRTFIIERCINIISHGSMNQTLCISVFKYQRQTWKSVIDGFKTANTKEI